eukprot:gene7443-11766_t
MSSSSLLISLTLACLTFSSLVFFREQILETNGSKVLGGFLLSLVFMFLFTALGNLQGSFRKEVGWFEVISW